MTAEFLALFLKWALLAAIVNVSLRWVFRANVWVTFSQTQFCKRYVGKAAVAGLVGVLVAQALQIDMLATILEQPATWIGRLISGFMIGGGAAGFEQVLVIMQRIRLTGHGRSAVSLPPNREMLGTVLGNAKAVKNETTGSGSAEKPL